MKSALGVRVHTLAQSVAAHDFQQAGVIRESECLGGASDVPIVFLERTKHDLPFGVRLQRLERSWRGSRVSGLIPFRAPPNLRGHISRADDGGISRNHHPLQTVSQL